jgi:hypothetical protein|tara:strand:+ start:297 stop:437 length:141 start_codon:yes stop_codon:yes gene_type:complete
MAEVCTVFRQEVEDLLPVSHQTYRLTARLQTDLQQESEALRRVMVS